MWAEEFPSSHEPLKALGQPGTFMYLEILVFSGTPIEDFDLIFLHYLPKLSVLDLNDTGVGNEA
ncbi:hypothetical protein DFP72DRAFT_1080442 [Ephemerocybe angulata]|uniref:Uncharacterized protein n=1 Tax=Ephemerocybe angulata TaxID=980116 RepID=A0A8H6HCC7_9AGAR|nr:hypothetical protein DFP72DRAFT_1080442 [Tulosesus angulatus]